MFFYDSQDYDYERLIKFFGLEHWWTSFKSLPMKDLKLENETSIFKGFVFSIKLHKQLSKKGLWDFWKFGEWNEIQPKIWGIFSWFASSQKLLAMTAGGWDLSSVKERFEVLYKSITKKIKIIYAIHNFKASNFPLSSLRGIEDDKATQKKVAHMISLMAW